MMHSSHRFLHLACALIALLVFFGGLILVRGWGENWNATPEEIRQTLPGDALVPDAQRTTLAITVEAPASQVWPWVIQMGAGRGGLYSYEWFENLIQCRVVNSNTIRSEFQALEPGDLVRMCIGDFGPPPWVVREVIPGQALLLGGKDQNGAWTYSLNQIVVSPVDGSTTRVFWRTSKREDSVVDVVLGPGFFVMQRRSLLGLRERAENAILPWAALDAGLLFWLLCFVAFLIAVAATALRHNWQPAFLASILAALVTLLLVMNMPPVWLDLLAVLGVWGALAWAWTTHPVVYEHRFVPVPPHLPS